MSSKTTINPHFAYAVDPGEGHDEGDEIWKMSERMTCADWAKAEEIAQAKGDTALAQNILEVREALASGFDGLPDDATSADAANRIRGLRELAS